MQGVRIDAPADALFALQKSVNAHVRFGSKADLAARLIDVRFISSSGHQNWLGLRSEAMFAAIRSASSLLKQCRLARSF
jgi:hypothetical protein